DQAPTLPRPILDMGLPILGICYGMQLLAHTLGGKVAPSNHREYGPAQITTLCEVPLWQNLPADLNVWMSHGDRIEQPPAGFVLLAQSANSPVAAMGDVSRGMYGIQFHPEVQHTPRGSQILANFVFNICGCTPDWTPSAFIDEAVEAVR